MSDGHNSQVGNVQVHKKVLEEIVYTAVKNVDGIQVGKSGFLPSFINVLTGAKFSGIRIKFDGANGIKVSLDVYIRYGLHIPDTARHAQDAIRASLEQTTEVDVKDINVNVQGVSREV